MHLTACLSSRYNSDAMSNIIPKLNQSSSLNCSSCTVYQASLDPKNRSLRVPLLSEYWCSSITSSPLESALTQEHATLRRENIYASLCTIMVYIYLRHHALIRSLHPSTRKEVCGRDPRFRDFICFCACSSCRKLHAYFLHLCSFLFLSGTLLFMKTPASIASFCAGVLCSSCIRARTLQLSCHTENL